MIQPIRSGQLLAFAILSCIAPLRAQPAENVAQRSLPSVVTLETYDDSGETLALGSGFILKGGRIATNAHVLTGAAWVEVSDYEGKYLGTASHAEALSTKLDLAVLPALGSVGLGLHLSGSEPIVGESVWVIGSPQGLGGSVSTGVVSAVRDFDGRTLLQISAPISQGSSGGPVLDSDGAVLGVAVGLLPSGQNLNFAVPSSDLSRLADMKPGVFQFPSESPRAGASSSTSRSNAALPEWVPLGTTETGDGATAKLYMQGNGLRVDGDLVWGWVHATYNKPNYEERIGRYDLRKTYLVFDCKRRRMSTQAIQWFSLGRVVDSIDWIRFTWSYPGAETWAELFLQLACGERSWEPFLE